jgi:deazaflavin-dependent oxidoreductase (nitroreductase family)
MLIFDSGALFVCSPGGGHDPAMAKKFQKESALDRIFNRLMGAAVKFGLSPSYMRLLEVRGRKTGKAYSTPVDLLDYEGKRWLVAARGETAWARNARAAGQIVLKRGSTSESVKVREVAESEKPPILKAFLDRYGSQVQRFFPVKAGSPVDSFREAATYMPAFELLRE